MQLEKKYYTVQDEATLKLLHQHISESDVIAVDTETSGLNPRKDKIIGWSVSGDEGIGFYLPTLVWDFSKNKLVLQTIMGESTEVISKNFMKMLKGKKLVFHNASFDCQFIKTIRTYKLYRRIQIIKKILLSLHCHVHLVMLGSQERVLIHIPTRNYVPCQR